MNTDHGLKVGDKIQPPSKTAVYDVLEVEGRFALVQSSTGDTYPIVFADEGWCSRIGGQPWTVVEPRWRADDRRNYTVIYDGNLLGRPYGIAVYGDGIDGDASEVVEAIVDLLNERFPA